jgi:hypothetical protein
MAAAYVITRDRQHNKRQQVDSVGIWGEFELCQDEDSIQHGFVTPLIHVKNASNLPVCVESVHYQAFYTWSCKAAAGYYFFPFDTEEGSFQGKIRDIVAPPGEEVVTCGVDKLPIDQPEASGSNATVTSRAPGSGLAIKEFVVIDNSNRRWRVVPRTDVHRSLQHQTKTRSFPVRFRPRLAHSGEASTRRRT